MEMSCLVFLPVWYFMGQGSGYALPSCILYMNICYFIIVLSQWLLVLPIYNKLIKGFNYLRASLFYPTKLLSRPLFKAFLNLASLFLQRLYDYYILSHSCLLRFMYLLLLCLTLSSGSLNEKIANVIKSGSEQNTMTNKSKE